MAQVARWIPVVIKSETVSDLIRQVAVEREMLLSGLEAAQIYHTVRAVAGIEGDIAETSFSRTRTG